MRHCLPRHKRFEAACPCVDQQRRCDRPLKTSRAATARVDGEPLKGKKPLTPNAIVAMGTTSFVVYDREGEMQTIISPLLPSIVKVLQKEEPKKSEEQAPKASEEPPKPIPMPIKPAEKHSTIGAFILIGTITAMFVLVGLGTATLFKSEPIPIKEQADPTIALDEALKPFPSVQKQFNRNTGRLFLISRPDCQRQKPADKQSGRA